MSLCHQSYLFVQGTWARDPTVKITKQLSVWCLTGARREYSVYSTAGLASCCCCREWRCVARFMLWVVPCRSIVSIWWIILNNTPGVCDGAVGSCEVAWAMCKSDSGLSHVLQPLTGPAWPPYHTCSPVILLMLYKIPVFIHFYIVFNLICDHYLWEPVFSHFQ